MRRRKYQVSGMSVGSVEPEVAEKGGSARGKHSDFPSLTSLRGWVAARIQNDRTFSAHRGCQTPPRQGLVSIPAACCDGSCCLIDLQFENKPRSHPLLLLLSYAGGPRRLPPRPAGRGPPAASAAGHPQGPADIFMLIVARGCVEQFPRPDHPFRNIRRLCTRFQGPRPWCGPPNHTPLRGSCSARRCHAQAPVPSALAARLPPHSPPNPTFAHRAEYRGLPVTRAARGTRASWRRSRVLMHSIARGQPIPSICWQNPELPVAVRRESPF